MGCQNKMILRLRKRQLKMADSRQKKVCLQIGFDGVLSHFQPRCKKVQSVLTSTAARWLKTQGNWQLFWISHAAAPGRKVRGNAFELTRRVDWPDEWLLQAAGR